MIKAWFSDKKYIMFVCLFVCLFNHISKVRINSHAIHTNFVPFYYNCMLLLGNIWHLICVEHVLIETVYFLFEKQTLIISSRVIFCIKIVFNSKKRTNIRNEITAKTTNYIITYPLKIHYNNQTILNFNC